MKAQQSGPKEIIAGRAELVFALGVSTARITHSWQRSGIVAEIVAPQQAAELIPGSQQHKSSNCACCGVIEMGLAGARHIQNVFTQPRPKAVMGRQCLATASQAWHGSLPAGVKQLTKISSRGNGSVILAYPSRPVADGLPFVAHFERKYSMVHVWLPQAESSPPLIWRRRYGIRALSIGLAVTVALALLLSL